MTPAPPLVPLIPANPPARGTPGYLTLSSAFIDPRLAATGALVECMREVLRDPGPSTFAHLQGYPPLRQAIAARLARAGIAADPAHILITVGSQHALDLVCRSLAVRRIAAESPAYGAGKALFALCDLAMTPLPLDPFRGLDAPAWYARLAAARPALAVVTRRFHNPTGYSYRPDELAQIAAWSAELGFGLLEDDWASDMLPGAPGPSLRALGGDDVLYMNAFTKKLVPSLRLGYLVASERTLPSLLQAKKLSINGGPALLEEALCALLECGHYDAHLARVQHELAGRYAHCLAALRAGMPAGVRWTEPGGGPLLWLELPRRVSIPRLIAELAERRVLVTSQDQAFTGTPHLHGVTLGYAFLDRVEMATAIEILGERLEQQL